MVPKVVIWAIKMVLKWFQRLIKVVPGPPKNLATLAHPQKQKRNLKGLVDLTGLQLEILKREVDDWKTGAER